MTPHAPTQRYLAGLSGDRYNDQSGVYEQGIRRAVLLPQLAPLLAPLLAPRPASSSHGLPWLARPAINTFTNETCS